MPKWENLVAAVVVIVAYHLFMWWKDFDPTVAPDDFESRSFWSKRRRVQARRRKLRRERRRASDS